MSCLPPCRLMPTVVLYVHTIMVTVNCERFPHSLRFELLLLKFSLIIPTGIHYVWYALLYTLIFAILHLLPLTVDNVALYVHGACVYTFVYVFLLHTQSMGEGG